MASDPTSTHSLPPALPWNARILTLFPAMFPGPLGQSLAGKALEKGLWSLDAVSYTHLTLPTICSV